MPMQLSDSEDHEREEIVSFVAKQLQQCNSKRMTVAIPRVSCGKWKHLGKVQLYLAESALNKRIESCQEGSVRIRAIKFGDGALELDVEQHG